MATFTSTQSGDWNDGGTWGNTSPGVKGTDWPGNAADIANVGDHVCYNVSETNELGNVVVTSGGNLYFSNSQNTKLTLGHSNLLVGQNAQLTVGNSGPGNYIPASHTAEILWNTTADNARKLVNSYGAVYVYGDGAYYGSTYVGLMANTWQGGQTFTVSGNVYDKWQAGHTLVIHKYPDVYNNYNTDLAEFTISSIWNDGGNTSILISEAAPGSATVFNAGGNVLHVTRNVKLSKLNYGTAVGCRNGNRPVIDFHQTTSTHMNHLTNCELGGFHRVEITRGFRIHNAVIRNGYYAVYDAAYGEVNDTIFFSHEHGVYDAYFINLNNIYACGNRYFTYIADFCTGSGMNIYSNDYGWRLSKNWIVEGNIYGNNLAARETYNCEFDVYMWGNDDTYYYGQDLFHTGGAIGYDNNDNYKPNNKDFIFNGYNRFYVSKTKVSSSLVLTNRTVTGISGSVRISDFNDEAGTFVDEDCEFQLLKDTTVTRSGGADHTLRLNPIDKIQLFQFGYFIKEWYEYGVTTGAPLTRMVYAMPVGWSSMPGSGRFCLEATYYSQNSGTNKETLTSTTALSANSTWTPLSVTFTPQQSSYVRYRMFLRAHEGGALIYIDDQLRSTA